MDAQTDKKIGHRWSPIEELPEDWESLASAELASLAPIWREQAEKLKTTEALDEFNRRLGREWAIETGIIEGLYSIDRGITQLLIEKGIEASLMPHGSTDKPAEEIVKILNDQHEVLDGLFDFVAHRRDLSVSYIKEMHAALTRNQSTVMGVDALGQDREVPLLHGAFKQQPNNPTRTNGTVHEYCPPLQVPSEMDRLIALHDGYIDRDVPPEVEAAWIHHRFTQIHPFQDGNGRIARSLASLIFLRAGWFPLVITRDIRAEYIKALECADRGELKPLVALFTQRQKSAFLAALNISEDVLHKQMPIQQVIAAAAERLKAKFEAKREEQRKVFQLSVRLEDFTRIRLENVCDEVLPSLTAVSRTYSCFTTRNDADNAYWFYRDIIETASALGYFADTRTHRAWIRLTIREERQSDILVSFHSVGQEFVGILGVSAFIKFKDRSEDGSTEEGPYRLCSEIFQFAFNEDADRVVSRFEGWLNEAVLAGIDVWRRQI